LLGILKKIKNCLKKNPVFFKAVKLYLGKKNQNLNQKG